MGAIGILKPQNGSGNSTNGAQRQRLNVQETYTPDYDDEVISFHASWALVTNVPLQAAVYDITLGVESSFRVGNEISMVNTATGWLRKVLDVSERIPLAAGKEYAIGYKTDANNWLFIPTVNQANRGWISETEVGTDAFPQYWGPVTEQTSWDSPIGFGTVRKHGIRLELKQTVTFP